jgi:hypothetical protein
MKNLHSISTDKPSRLCINGKNQIHIYITNSEEIKEGDWVFNLKSKGVYSIFILNEVVNYEKKIILTTDQELIKDGVQPIDDEFLEWFVENPNCESVKVNDLYNYTNENTEHIGYKIIIPQEELCSFCNGTGQIVSSTKISGFKTCDCINIPQEEPKQTDEKGNPLTFWGGLKKHKKESIEEEAELFAKSRVELDPIYANGLYYGFIQCGMSKWFEAEKIKAQIEENLSVLEMLEIHGTESSMFRVKMRIAGLEQQLKQLYDGI